MVVKEQWYIMLNPFSQLADTDADTDADADYADEIVTIDINVPSYQRITQ